MGLKRQLAGASAFFVLMAGAAQAEFLAEDLWAAWQEKGNASGVAVSAQSERVDEATLILSGVVVTLPGSDVPVALDELRLTSYDDDTVGIELGKVVYAQTGNGVEALKLELLHKELNIYASQGPEGLLSYEWGAESVTVHYEQTSEGMSWDPSVVAEPAVTKGAITLEDVGGALTDVKDGLRKIEMSLDVSKVLSEQSSSNPGFESEGSQTGVVDGLTLSTFIALPDSLTDAGVNNTADFEAALRDGFEVHVTLAQGAAQSSISENGGMMPMQIETNAPGSRAEMQINKERISFGAEVDGETAVNVATPMSEAPMQLTLAGLNVYGQIPSLLSEGPGDYELIFGLNDLVLSENVWAMFDPAQTLARGPFAIDLNLSGKMAADLEKAAETAMTGDFEAVPQIQSMDINSLLLQAATTKLEGKGNLTFTNADIMPEPLGKIDFTLTNLADLLKALVGFGVVGEEEAAMTEAMIGGFAVPTSDPNVLTSEVEFKEGGSVFVNGMQVQ